MTEADFNKMMKDPYGAPFLDYHGEDYAALIATLQGERDYLRAERDALARQLERRADGMDPLTETLRVRCFELEDENEKLEARVREVEAERLQEMLEYSVKLQRLVECAARALRGEKFVLPEDSKGLHHYDMLKEIFDKGAA